MDKVKPRDPPSTQCLRATHCGVLKHTHKHEDKAELFKLRFSLILRKKWSCVLEFKNIFIYIFSSWYLKTWYSVCGNFTCVNECFTAVMKDWKKHWFTLFNCYKVTLYTYSFIATKCNFWYMSKWFLDFPTPVCWEANKNIVYIGSTKLLILNFKFAHHIFF